MLRAFALAALGLATPAFGGCSSTAPDAIVPEVPVTETAAPGQSVRIPLGEAADVGGLSVRFAEVAEDSRCPEGTTCVWEGRARVRLVVGGTPALLTVPHGGSERADEPSSVSVGTRTLDVTALHPYPGSSEATGGARVEVEVAVSGG